jgi:hypothetical protein
MGADVYCGKMYRTDESDLPSFLQGEVAAASSVAVYQRRNSANA